MPRGDFKIFGNGKALAELMDLRALLEGGHFDRAMALRLIDAKVERIRSEIPHRSKTGALLLELLDANLKLKRAMEKIAQLEAR